MTYVTYENRLEAAGARIAKRWDKLLSNKKLGLEKNNDLITVLTIGELERVYGAEWRRYLTFFRLEQMFEEFDKVRDMLKHPECVEFAIFLHGYIYVVGKMDNMAQSAYTAQAWLSALGASGPTTLRVVRLIIIGTMHPMSLKARFTNDQKYLSDIELYGFSLSWDSVLGQARDVRREFSKFSDEEFKKRYGDFIMSMMRGRVYHTPHYAQYELRAKENMRRLLQNMDQVVMARPNDKRL